MDRFACLMYHSLSDGKWPDRFALKYSVSRKGFEAAIKFLADSNYVVCGCDDFVSRINNRSEIPSNYCLMTIDDGHKSGLEMAEVLSQYNFGATFFLTKSYCESRNDFFNTEDILKLAGQGFGFGTHGVSHKSLEQMSDQEVRQELLESKMWLEKILQRNIETMSLPGGQGGARTMEIAFDLGYKLVCSSREALNNVTKLPAAINRFAILNHYDSSTISKMLQGDVFWIAKRRLRSLLLYLPKRVLRTMDKTR